MKQKYINAINYLTEHQNEICGNWRFPFDSKSRGGCLFTFCCPSGSRDYGCITQVKSGLYDSFSKDLTKKILNDHRVPKDKYGITVENLHVFAEYQEYMDNLWNRE